MVRDKQDGYKILILFVSYDEYLILDFSTAMQLVDHNVN
jgi:hypothetical protein